MGNTTSDDDNADDDQKSNSNVVYNEEVIQQLLTLNVATTRDEITNAMDNVVNPNDINEITEFITNKQQKLNLQSDNDKMIKMNAKLNSNDNDNDDHSMLPILVTGGAGYIGSHTVIELINSGFTRIIIVDNFSNSSAECINRIKQITSAKNPIIIYYEIDIARNVIKLDEIIGKHKPYACIHFAGFKAVGESVSKPVMYYQNNLISTINLIEVLHKYNCNNFIFASSCTVYGNNPLNQAALTEQSQIGVGITNPYAKTKYWIEEMLRDIAKTNKLFRVIILRYFNSIGAHPSGIIGKDPHGIPTCLMPFIQRVAVAQQKKDIDKVFYNKYKQLNVFGNDYDTVDGTCIRDYVHVVDVARGHVNSLLYDIMAPQSSSNNVSIYNLGSCKGTSVLQLKASMENACGFTIPHVIKPRRAGDIAAVYSDCSLAKQKIKWEAQYTVNDACKDAWNFQSKNPYGYAKK